MSAEETFLSHFSLSKPDELATVGVEDRVLAEVSPARRRGGSTVLRYHVQWHVIVSLLPPWRQQDAKGKDVDVSFSVLSCVYDAS